VNALTIVGQLTICLASLGVGHKRFVLPSTTLYHFNFPRLDSKSSYICSLALKSIASGNEYLSLP